MTQNNHFSSFTNTAEEPTKALTPIRGYQTKNLVSLEEVLDEVNPPVLDVATMIWLVKQDSSDPPNVLTTDKSAATRLYTKEWCEASQSVYSILNKKLRLWFSYLK
ncbi:unnamed protein product [Adineta ricciae]|uniref:Uncharacterized protein n=1 Tax=Adineta ricciae TaxID=249248 RepID=A0A813SBG9_ADIRI|nr:unnamed protein product [Adineta ricciae]CAF0792838.1 unnamed protein product [Adineta ricciae]